MAGDRQQQRQHERGTTTLEFVAVAVVAGLLALTIGVAARTDGATLGSGAGGRLEQLVLGDKRWRDQREHRRQGGQVPQRVPRDELRLAPVFDERAAWSRRWSQRPTVAGTPVAIDAKACALCAALEWGHEARSGASTGSDGAQLGVELGAEGEARLALAAADASLRAARDLGPARVSGQGRVRGMVGGEARGTATLRLGRTVQDLELEGGATAGAVARAEGQLGVDLLGIAIRQGGQVEGWAGAGARGVAGVRREGEQLSWRFGWGAALGLGGAAEWRGSVDVSGVPQRHRRLARDALAVALQSAFGIPATIRF